MKSKLQRDLSRETKKGGRHFYTSFHIADISLEVKRIRDKTLTYNNVDLEVAISNLDLFFLINQLNYACNVVNTRRILQAPKYEFPLLEKIVDKLPSTPYFDLPLIEVYWNSYKMLFTDNKAYYSTLKLLLFNHYHVLIKYHQINLFNHLQNYCIQKINSGDSTYYAELWEISIFRLENGLIKELSPASYKNLITTGVMLALQQENTDFAAVLQFIENYTEKLPIEYREEAQTYAQSYIAFYQNHFQVVPQKLIVNQEPLTLYKFEDIFYQIDARRLLVMTYFCLEEEDNFDKLCSNQSVFLSERRELIPELELEKNRQFLVIIKRLFWIHGSRMERTEQLQQLKKEIEEAENISDRIWLLKQVEAKSK
ncbi:MAG: hypothetical protein R3E32_18010 [Chitinophagales bacterium]